MATIGSNEEKIGAIDQWLSEVNKLIKRLNAIDFGYPSGGNVIHPPASEELLEALSTKAKVPKTSTLSLFYSRCNGVDLPDVHVGYFIHSIELVIRGIQSGEPLRILQSSGETGIVIFGTDGGGGRFAMKLDESGEILYLPVGRVIDSTFDGQQTPARFIADDFLTFLERLNSAIAAFIDNDTDWKYLV
jgi:hypothetical protein